MIDEALLKKVIALFSTMTEVPTSEITADSELIDDLEISSMDVLFLISSLEEEFHISVSEKEIRKMVTVGDVVQVIQELKNKLGRNNKNPQ